MRRGGLNRWPEMATVLVRYGELALKSPPVRREFERALQRNILEQFLPARIDCRLRADHGHLYVETALPHEAVRLLRRVFGVTSVSPVEVVSSDLQQIRSRTKEWAGTYLSAGASFAVRARRTGTHPFTSQDLARDLGGLVLETWPERHLRVNLDRPDVELAIEVRGPLAYLSAERMRGPGGFPLGVAGRVVAYVDGRRGALGAYLMMKRGCRTALAVTPEGRSLVSDVLVRFDPRCTIRFLGDTGADAGETRDLLAETHAEGIVLPLTVDEFPGARQVWGETVVFSPTVAFTEPEVEELWGKVIELSG